MPIYEWLCASCGRRFSTFSSVSEAGVNPPCPACGLDETSRVVSRFAIGKTEDQRLGQLSDRLETSGEPDSLQGMRELVREAGQALDEGLGDDMVSLFDQDSEEETSSAE
ncbi:MAG: zinc ribbon domain-containing protein [Fimbriimonadaceae bacterium]|nr:MAG: putative regulatory protein, FmdB family [Armatimonadetes bacterium OLB18]WKZ79567.1 MAG: zinc ribbon domain-containing protein [Fimbriimonadaceae bacterium]